MTLKDAYSVGGGIGRGDTCKSMADSYLCLTKPTTINIYIYIYIYICIYIYIYIFYVKNNNYKIKIKDAYSLEGKL